jgi:DHA1 family tetracycline resistance protein-like MFS transporter
MSNLTRMTIISFILFMSLGITGPVSSLYYAFLGASYVEIGLLWTVTSLTVIIFGFVWGGASDSLGGRKPFLVTGLAAMALIHGLIAIAPSYHYLFPLRVLSAVAMAAYTTSSLALMGDLLERRATTRGRSIGVYRGLGSLGFGLMAFASGSVADRLSLRAPFGLGALFLLVAVALSLTVQEPRTSPGARPLSSTSARTLLTVVGRGSVEALNRLVAVLRPRANELRRERSGGGAGDAARLPLTPLLISAFLWSLVTGAVYAVWANYMVDELGYSQAAMSRLWALASLSEFPLMIVAGWLSDHLGRLGVLCLGFLAWTLVFVGYVSAPWMPWILSIQLTRGFAYSAYTAAAMTYATEVRSREQRGMVSGLYNSAGGLGAILGSSMGGIQTQLMGFRAMIGTNAALIFGGAVYLAATVRQVRVARKHGRSV